MKQVHVPVRVHEDGTLEYFYGGAVPSLAPGTVGELVVPEASFVTPEDATRVDRGHRVELLPAQTTILFAVNGTDAPESTRQRLRDGGALPGAVKPHAAEVVVTEPLVLRLRGRRSAALEDASCWIATLGTTVDSLDDAYHAISEAIEHRRTTAPDAIFRFGFTRHGAGWRSLADRRQECEARYDIDLSPAAAPVLRGLPPGISALLRLCWMERLDGADSLEAALKAYRARLHASYARDEQVDLSAADELIGTCRRLVASLSAETPEDRHRLIQAAVGYLVRDTDEESDTRSPVGLMDDALVVRAVAAAVESP